MYKKYLPDDGCGLFTGNIDDNIALTQYLEHVMEYIIHLRRKYAL